MVVEPFNAYNDHGDDRTGDDRRTTTISQAISRPRNTRYLHAHVFSLDTRNLLQKRRLGIPRDGCVDATTTDLVLRRTADVLYDPILRRGHLEQHHLG